MAAKIDGIKRSQTLHRTLQLATRPQTEKRLSPQEIARRTGLAKLAPGLAERLAPPQRNDASAPPRSPSFTRKGITANAAPMSSGARADGSDGARGWLGGLLERAREAVAAAQKGAEEFRGASTEERKAMLEEARARFNQDQDPHAMDSVDLFRDRLDPQARLQYDAQLQALRDDPRVRVVDADGNPADPATRELVLRGMLAATFPDQQMLDNAIQTAVDSKFEDGKVKQDGEGTFDVIVYPGSFNIGDHTYPGHDGQAPGLKTRDGDVVISEEFLDHTIAAGEHLMIHEFAHCLQGASDDGGVSESRLYPEDFPFGDQVDAAFESDPAFRAYIEGRFGTVHGGAERFPTLMNVFRTEPEALRAACPELYDMMVRYTGLDPISGKTIPPDQIDRRGSGGGGFWGGIWDTISFWD